MLYVSQDELLMLLLVIETDQLDYIHDFVHRLDVMERIEAVLPEEFGKPEC